jgi:hypothetical protein
MSFGVKQVPLRTLRPLAFHGDLLLTAGGGPGMTFVDVSNPVRPEILGSQDVGGVVQDLRVGSGFVMARVHVDPTALDALTEVRLYKLEGRAAELAGRVTAAKR